MSDNTKPPAQPVAQEQLHTMRIDGKSATPRDAKRILTTSAVPVDKDDIATKPLHSAVRGFNLMR